MPTKVLSVDHDGTIRNHAQIKGGIYETICGVETHDPGQRIFLLGHMNGVITCELCLEVWFAARMLQAEDFDARMFF